MGKEWDGGDIAFRPDTWALIWRVLKPGGHMVAFGAPKNYHRLACAIEDAGFEIRDSLMWVFGTGFPKSMDVSKAIDKVAGKTSDDVNYLKDELRRVFDASGMTLAQLNISCGFEASGYLRKSSTWASVLPTPEKWWRMREAIGCEDEFSSAFEAAERAIIGPKPWSNSSNHFVPGENHKERVHLYDTSPATDAAKEWAGWGTALKPAYEPIVLARKPLSEKTVAANVLRWGTGALNIDATRIGATRGVPASLSKCKTPNSVYGDYGGGDPKELDPNMGRWPANLCHDGSEEVLGLFPQSNGSGPSRTLKRGKRNPDGWGMQDEPGDLRDAGTGSAARFFYSAKASKADRAGSKHPTVKPVAIMQWLVRMVTPPGGTVLDPFAGSGTTAQAAVNEGFQAVLIEREEEYQSDIRNRLSA